MLTSERRFVLVNQELQRYENKVTKDIWYINTFYAIIFIAAEIDH